MTPVEIIERVLETQVLKKSLTYIPDTGATLEELTSLSKNLPRELSGSHVCLLGRWNGINLDIVRIFSASSTNTELRSLTESQLGRIEGVTDAIFFGDDPSGFLYLEDSLGEIYSLDSQSGNVRQVAVNLVDFFARLVFGKDAADFAGDDWHRDLKRVGLG